MTAISELIPSLPTITLENEVIGEVDIPYIAINNFNDNIKRPPAQKYRIDTKDGSVIFGTISQPEVKAFKIYCESLEVAEDNELLLPENSSDETEEDIDLDESFDKGIDNSLTDFKE